MSEWIRCTPETMPPFDESVLIWHKRYGIEIALWGGKVFHYNDDEYYCVSFDDGPITHWQITIPPDADKTKIRLIKEATEMFKSFYEPPTPPEE